MKNIKISLIESGRSLNEEKTFQEEDIENLTAFTLLVDKEIRNLTEKKIQNKD